MKRLSVGQATLLAALTIILILTAVWAVSVWNRDRRGCDG